MNDRHKLIWSHPTTSHELLIPLPAGITRTYIPTPLGRLELLIAQPTTAPSIPRKKALLFQHGGFGHAGVWIPFLTYFSQRGYPCYAVSLRGHGASWKPGFLRMVWGYGKRHMAEDLGYAFAFVTGLETGAREGKFESSDLVLLAHSAGGGVSQYFLGQNLGQVGGLVIIAGYPCFGGLGVYWNWFKLDPWFAPRYYIRDLCHSRSPLSSTTLVHNAFFSPAFPRAEVVKFEVYMTEYESMLWPLGMTFPFVNVKNVVRNILGWNNRRSSRLLVVAGERDKLMGVTLMQRMAMIYHKTAAKLLLSSTAREIDEKEGDVENVEFKVIRDSGHHVQNDLHWEKAAEEIDNFLEQL